MLTLKRNVYAPFRNQIYEKLKNKIIFGSWPPGSLLTEVELAKSFGISRTPIREVTRRLESEGLIKVLPKKGILIPEIEEKDVEDIFELREIIYCHAVEKAIQKITLKDIERLERIVASAERGIEEKDTTQLVSLSLRFHEYILKLAGNSRFLDVDKVLRAHIIRNSSELLDIKERKQVGWEGHKRIVAALKKRDKKLASMEMRDHFQKGKRLLLSKMSPLSAKGLKRH